MTSTTTDHPIIFSAPMVRALLDGRKMMTRRLAQKKSWNSAAPPSSLWKRVRCGDRLWVRESFCAGRPALPSGAGIIPMRGGIPKGRKIVYRADWDGPDEPPWRPPFALPRWASRITLTVTATKIERLNDISEGDAVLEGMAPMRREQDGGPINDPRDDFCALWEHLHGPGAWDANPEVVAISFTVMPNQPEQQRG